MRFLRRLLWGLAFVAAAIFIVTLAVGQLGCPIQTCKGPDGDAWMPAFFFAPLGLPALVISVFFVARKIWPNSPFLWLWLKYLFFVIIAVVILTPFIFGFLDALKSTSHHIQVRQ